MYLLKGKYGRRFRRTDAIYLFWEIVIDKFKDNLKFINIVNFALNRFYRKSTGQEEMFCTISLNKRFVLEDLLNVLKKHSNYLFLRDFDITDEFSQVGVIINFKSSKDINSLSTELNRTYSGVNIKFLNKQALG